jgi:tetratricopeptide (TPR) repeat protein
MADAQKTKSTRHIVLVSILVLFTLALAFRIVPMRKIVSRYVQMRTKNINTYLKQNEEEVTNSCMDTDDSVKYYRDIYSTLIRTIYSLEKKGFLRKADRAMLFSILKNGPISELQGKIDSLGLVRLDSHSLSRKYLMMALGSEMNFDRFHRTEELYKKAIDSDRFDLQNYFLLAKFYQRNCGYDEAIDTLLTISSVANSSSQKINLSDNYRMLADLYMAKRDYENALANYANSLVILDSREKDRDKTRVLTSLGDIMMVRGNHLEAINYYKYALSIGKVKPKMYIDLLLKLSNAYYSYGNYLNGLKFAIMATNRAKQLGNVLLYSKSKYSECLNYEYLGEQKKAAGACAVALEEGKRYAEDVSDYQSHVHLADMLDFSMYIRDAELATKHLEIAKNLIKNSRDIYRKISVLERLANIKARSGSGDAVVFSEASSIFGDLETVYRANDIEIGCCNSLISGFLMERSGEMGNAEKFYLRALGELKNRKKQLGVLYSYMADFYGNRGRKREALFYAKKALEINSQIYRFDHHSVKYALDRIAKFTKSQEK